MVDVVNGNGKALKIAKEVLKKDGEAFKFKSDAKALNDD